jgi:phage terminase small subunit
VMRGLRPKYARFVQEYLVDLNGTQAAIRAGYAAANADVQASQLLRIPKVAAALAEALAERQRRCDLTADRVLLEFARLAYADIRALYDADGQLKRPCELDAAIAPAVAQLEVRTTTRKSGEIETVQKVRLVEKVPALRALAEHLGMLKMRLDVEAPTMPIRIVHELHCEHPTHRQMDDQE